jgi:hypothetical protein
LSSVACPSFRDHLTLCLQDRGLGVVGIDNFLLAIKVCKKRGVKDASVVPITQISPKLGAFDTVIVMDNNFYNTGIEGWTPQNRNIISLLIYEANRDYRAFTLSYRLLT